MYVTVALFVSLYTAISAMSTYNTTVNLIDTYNITVIDTNTTADVDSQIESFNDHGYDARPILVGGAFGVNVLLGVCAIGYRCWNNNWYCRKPSSQQRQSTRQNANRIVGAVTLVASSNANQTTVLTSSHNEHLIHYSNRHSYDEPPPSYEIATSALYKTTLD